MSASTCFLYSCACVDHWCELGFNSKAHNYDKNNLKLKLTELIRGIFTLDVLIAPLRNVFVMHQTFECQVNITLWVGWRSGWAVTWWWDLKHFKIQVISKIPLALSLALPLTQK